jgi:hypothetical protein
VYLCKLWRDSMMIYWYAGFLAFFFVQFIMLPTVLA